MLRECFCSLGARISRRALVRQLAASAHRRRVALLLTLGLALVARAASAQVIPLVPKMEPAKAAEIVNLFHKALADGLKTGGLKVMAPGAVLKKLKLPPANAGCAGGACLNTALVAFGSKRFGAAMVQSVGKNYRIEVRIYQGKKKLTGVSGRCDICTLSEALKKMRTLASEVGGKTERPPGATAKKPPKKAVPPGKATAKNPNAGKTPKKTAAATSGSKIGASGGATGSPGASGGAAPGASDTGRRWPLWPVLASAGVGVLGLAIGLPLLAIDGNFTNCTGTALPDGSNCADIYSTSGVGWLMTGLGIAGTVASGVLFYLWFRSRGRERKTASTSIGVDSVGLMPTAQGVVFGALGRF